MNLSVPEPTPAWLCQGCGAEIAGHGVVLIARRDLTSGAVGGRPDPTEVCRGSRRPYEVGVYHPTSACAPSCMLRGSVLVPLLTPVSAADWMQAVGSVAFEPWASRELLSDLLQLWWTHPNYRHPGITIPAAHGKAAA